MSTFNLTHPAGFATGQPQKAKHWSDPLDEIEAALQAELNGDNFGNETLRGSSFRRSGLTEVFRRDNVGNPWVCWPSGNSELVDVPGGALRFRLRAPATVMVYFSSARTSGTFHCRTIQNSSALQRATPSSRSVASMAASEPTGRAGTRSRAGS